MRCQKLNEEKNPYFVSPWSSQVETVFLVLVQTSFDLHGVGDILKCTFFVRDCCKTSHGSEAVSAA